MCHEGKVRQRQEGRPRVLPCTSGKNGDPFPTSAPSPWTQGPRGPLCSELSSRSSPPTAGMLCPARGLRCSSPGHLLEHVGPPLGQALVPQEPRVRQEEMLSPCGYFL